MSQPIIISETNPAQVNQQNGGIVSPQWIMTRLPTSLPNMPPLPPQEWLFSLSGIALIPQSLSGTVAQVVIRILPDFGPPFGSTGIVIPNFRQAIFRVQQYTTLVSFAGLYMTVETPRVPGGGNRLSNPIFYIDSFQPFWVQGQQKRIMEPGCGIEVVVNVHDPNAALMSLAYQMTLVGTMDTEPIVGPL